MTDFLNHPAVQGGVAPLVVALVVALLLARSRLAWLAIIAGYLTTIALSTGFQFSPLTASRKIVLASVVAAAVGLAADVVRAQGRGLATVLALVAGASSLWIFASVLAQRQGSALYIMAAGIAAFVALLTASVQTLRADGLRTGAAGVGLGVAVGVCAIVSASIGFLLTGIALAAASGAVLLAQVVFSRAVPAGFTGAFPIAVMAGLFAAGTLTLAELPWYALPLMLLVPLAARLPVSERLPPIARAALLVFCTLVAAAFPIAAAWYAARGSLA